MVFQCTGTAYCLDSDGAIVSLTFGNEETQVLRFQGAPICITTKDLDSQAKCYRFAGMDVYGINSFELFLCGTNPGYVPVQGGVSPAFNGVIATDGSNYRYKSGTESITQVTEIIRNPNVFQSTGDCNSCLVQSGSVKVTITDKNNNKLYEKIGLSPQIKVSCNGCAPGEIKCNCHAYPGFCCISCSEIKSEIRNITATVRKLNNG